MNIGRIRLVLSEKCRRMFAQFMANRGSFNARLMTLLWIWQRIIPSTPGTLLQPKSTSRRLLYLAAPGALLALPWTVSLKDYFGVQKVTLDKDPIKDKIKYAKLHCKYKRYQEAINVLNEAMEEAKNPANEVAITYIITELANIYLEIGQLDNAESLYRDAIIRQIRLHGRNEMSPEFIVLSLRLSDVFARKGDLENAEIGYKHCVSKQMAMDNHLKNYLVAKGAVMEEKHPADVHGPKYTDPIALFGMTLEDYAHFLVENYSQKEDRMNEACEYIDEMIKKFEISHHIFGGYAAPLMVSLNNFGVRCIAKNRFETAKKYLSIGIDRVLKIDNCAPILVNYYVNYAEALFHCGQIEEAMKYATEAEKLAQSQEPAVKEYAEKYRKSMERDARRQSYNKSPSAESGQIGWRSWIPF